MATIGTPGPAAVNVSTMLRQPALQPRKQVGRARPVEPVGVRVEASLDHVVRADLERDERDLPRMRLQERDRRVQLRPGRDSGRAECFPVIIERVVSPGQPTFRRVSPGICCCMVSNRSSTYPSVVLPWPGW